MELMFVFLVLNMSTSCQLAFSVNSDELVPLVADSTCPVQYFPYFEDSYLAIAASLNGGNVLTHFVAMLQQWLSCFGKINFDVFQIIHTNLVLLKSKAAMILF